MADKHIWTISCDVDGTYRLKERNSQSTDRTIVTSGNRENFYEMVDGRRERAANEGLLIELHDEAQHAGARSKTKNSGHQRVVNDTLI